MIEEKIEAETKFDDFPSYKAFFLREIGEFIEAQEANKENEPPIEFVIQKLNVTEKKNAKRSKKPFFDRTAEFKNK